MVLLYSEFKVGGGSRISTFNFRFYRKKPKEMGGGGGYLSSNFVSIIKIVRNIPWTYEKLYCIGEPYRYSGLVKKTLISQIELNTSNFNVDGDKYNICLKHVISGTFLQLVNSNNSEFSFRCQTLLNDFCSI